MTQVWDKPVANLPDLVKYDEMILKIDEICFLHRYFAGGHGLHEVDCGQGGQRKGRV